MNRFLSLTIGLSLALVVAMPAPQKASAYFSNIKEYDDQTHVNARILDGTILPVVVKQYQSIGTQAQLWITASMNVLTTKYAPACLAAGCATK